MKAYAITWDIKSYDGDRILSVWLDKSEATKELCRLRQSYIYSSSVGLTEVELDTPNGFDHI